MHSSMNIKMNIGQYVTCFLLLIATSFVSAQDSFLSESLAKDSNDFSDLFQSSHEAEFLPVLEAYQASAIITANNTLELHWDIAEGYYLYQERLAIVQGQTPLDRLTFAKGTLKYDDYYEKDMEVYYQSTTVIAENVIPDSDADIFVLFQGCADSGLCYPPTWIKFTNHSGILTFAGETSEPQQITTSSTASKRPNELVNTTQNAQTIANTSSTVSNIAPENIGLFIAILMAFLGGMILNLMPCVFPILAMKALSFTQHSGTNKASNFAIAYTLGTITTSVIVAAVLLLLRASGEAVGWGFQLQSPAVVIALATLFFIIGLNLSGFFEIPSRLAGIGHQLTQGQSGSAHFFTGVLAMVVASPCSAPFMAVSLGFAITQPAPIALLVFAALGLGVAAPLACISLIPQLGKHLPKPGAWMQTLRETLAFPMFITSIWLIWVLSAMLSSNGIAMVLLAMLLLVFTIWCCTKVNRSWQIPVALLLITLSVVIFNLAIKSPKDSQTTETFDLALFEQRVQQPQALFLDVTADWCITCKVNERRVLKHPDIQAAFKNANVEVMIADWTNKNSAISELLDQYQRVGIPLYLYFPPNSTEAVVLPQLLTKKMIFDLLAM